MTIRPINAPRDLRAFIDLPYRLYRHDPIWVPPLRSEQRSQFDPQLNPFLQHCEWQLFLAEEAGAVVGRIAAFIDRLANDAWQQPIGLFGYLECTPSPETARSLLAAARDWLRARGCTAMRGPWSFVSQDWGMVVEGFSPSPVIMAPYNPPHYNDYLVDFGMHKAKDLLCWSVSAAEGYDIPDRIKRLTDAVAKRYGVRVRPVDMRRYDQEVQTVIEVSNASLADNWGYSPVTEAEVRAMARDLKQILQPKGVLIAEDRSGRPIGFAITLPDVNWLLKGLNGRLFPFGFLKLLYGIPRLRRYRMFALGVIPEYHGRAVDSLLYRALYESLYAPDVWMEINYVLEDNWPMVNAIHKLGAKPLRRYRVYETAIEPVAVV
jgi:GNAT superfamily N-acetyltransferase